MKFDPERHRLCVITSREISRGRGHEDVARRAVAGGASVIQLRDKTMTSRELYDVAVTVRAITRERGALFIVNDRPDIAVASDADGVHVGDDDMPVQAARSVVGPDMIVGASAGSPEEAVEAEVDGADYIGVGPIYEARKTKPDAGVPQGVDLLRRVRQRSTLPILAIGGVDERNAPDTIRAGASGVAVISAVVAAEDIPAATRRLLRAIRSAVGEEEVS